MDKSSFCDSIRKQLIDLEDAVQSNLTTAPSTASKADAIDARRPKLEDAVKRARELRSRVEKLRDQPGDLEAGDRRSIETELEKILTLVR